MTGTLTFVGTGTNLETQLTADAQAAIREADELVSIANHEVFTSRLKELNPAAPITTLFHLYRPGVHRDQTYSRMADEFLRPAIEGRNTCVILDGHPGVGVFATSLAIDRARGTGVHVRMLPAVSSLDALFADLAIDPFVTGGLQCYDAGYFLMYRPHITFDATLVLLQPMIGLIDDGGIYELRTESLRRLVDYLGCLYGPDQHAILYSAATALTERSIRIFTLGDTDLPTPDDPIGATLCIPPAAWWTPRMTEPLRDHATEMERTP